jgi:LDH2 family malate/lactate/ureidoglycolate dehydrogenase
MLERFKVPAKDAVRVKEARLREVVAAIFEKMNVPPEDARIAADTLVVADLRGCETHGVSNTLRHYVKAYQEGKINPRPNWRVVRESPSTALVDSDFGHGLIVTPKAMEIAIKKADRTGIGMVVVDNGRHLGMCAYYAMQALEHNMIGVCMTSGGGQAMVPTFARDALLGTNPLAIAVPTGKESPFVFDAAMTSIAGNKIALAKRVGSSLLPGWLADEHGNPIMVPIDPPKEGHKMLPWGTTRELGSHKGYSMGMAVDILAGVLSGAGHSMRIPRGEMSHTLIAIKIASFIAVEDFKKDMDDMLYRLRTARPAAGCERVLYAGLPEAEETKERKAHGIPLHKEVVEWFKGICEELSIPFTLTK